MSSRQFIDVRCPHCNESYELFPIYKGKAVRCRQCQRVFRATQFAIPVAEISEAHPSTVSSVAPVVSESVPERQSLHDFNDPIWNFKVQDNQQEPSKYRLGAERFVMNSAGIGTLSVLSFGLLVALINLRAFEEYQKEEKQKVAVYSNESTGRDLTKIAKPFPRRQVFRAFRGDSDYFSIEQSKKPVAEVKFRKEMEYLFEWSYTINMGPRSYLSECECCVNKISTAPNIKMHAKMVEQNWPGLDLKRKENLLAEVESEWSDSHRQVFLPYRTSKGRRKKFTQFVLFENSVLNSTSRKADMDPFLLRPLQEIALPGLLEQGKKEMKSDAKKVEWEIPQFIKEVIEVEAKDRLQKRLKLSNLKNMTVTVEHVLKKDYEFEEEIGLKRNVIFKGETQVDGETIGISANLETQYVFDKYKQQITIGTFSGGGKVTFCGVSQPFDMKGSISLLGAKSTKPPVEDPEARKRLEIFLKAFRQLGG